MKNVLIALDYDPDAINVVESGYILAKSLQSKITLLHVIADKKHYSRIGHISVTGFFSGHIKTRTMPPKIRLDPWKVSQEFLDKIKFHFGDSIMQILIREGNIAKNILSTAEEITAEIIILGSQNNSENTDVGDVIKNVMANTSIPVLIIPTKK